MIVCARLGRFAGSLPRPTQERRYTSGLLSDILRNVQQGNIQPDEAERLIQQQQQPAFNQTTAVTTPEDTLLSFANLDHTRAGRTGFPEVVFGEGKTPEQVARILDDMARNVKEQMTGSIPQVASAKAILATRYVHAVFSFLDRT
jgi:pyridinium-3,5-biscarboxylic acid mononucleotide synthase